MVFLGCSPFKKQPFFSFFHTGMSTFLKNPGGAIVELTDERARYLLDETPTKTLPNGQKYAVQKSSHEIGWSRPTDAELKAYQAKFSPKAGQAKPNGDTETPVENLRKVNGIGKKTAENLVAAGIQSVDELKQRFDEQGVQEVIGTLAAAGLRKELFGG